jgi:hypothetical protein
MTSCQPNQYEPHRGQRLTVPSLLLVGLAWSTAACSTDDPGTAAVRSPVTVSTDGWLRLGSQR